MLHPRTAGRTPAFNFQDNSGRVCVLCVNDDDQFELYDHEARAWSATGLALPAGIGGIRGFALLPPSPSEPEALAAAMAASGL